MNKSRDSANKKTLKCTLKQFLFMTPKSLDERRLEAILVEYGHLRSEIIETVKLHLQLYTLLLSAIGVSLGYAFVNKAYEVFLVMPVVSFAFFYRWLWDQNSIMGISYYQIVEIERKKLPVLIGYVKDGSKDDYETYWVGWQHFWNDNMLKNPLPRVHVYAILLMFILPVLLSIWRTLFYIQSLLPVNLPITSIDWSLAIQIVLNCVYSILLIHALLTYRRLYSYYTDRYKKELGYGPKQQ